MMMMMMMMVKNIIWLLLGFIGVTLAAIKWKDARSLSYSFEDYLAEFYPSQKYSENEYQTRKELFNVELERVINHNKKGLSWTEGINKFSSMSSAEKKSYFGRIQHDKKEFKSQKEYELIMKDINSLPETVDWRTKGVVSTVKDQGHCGSCWAFAATATIESHIALSSGLLFELSTEQIAMCAPNPNSCGGYGGCQGSTAELAFDYLANNEIGIFEEYQYSYSSYYGQDYTCAVPNIIAVGTIGGFVKLPGNNYTALMNAVATVGPISINVDASSWHAYESGVFAGCDQASPDVNHVVVTVGYGVAEDGKTKYWLVRNSWNPSWGEKGYIRLARFDNDEEVCGIDSTPQDGVECADTADTPVKVCGTCGAIYDSSYPIGAVVF